jgi:hypothetical protein
VQLMHRAVTAHADGRDFEPCGAQLGMWAHTHPTHRPPAAACGPAAAVSQAITMALQPPHEAEGGQ